MLEMVGILVLELIVVKRMRKYTTPKSSVAMVILLMLMLIFLSSYAVIVEPSSPQTPENEPDFILKYNTRADLNTSLDPLVLKGNNDITITNKSVFGNLEMSDYSTLRIENTEVDFNGTVEVTGNTRIFISNSTVRINPPALADDVIVVNLKGSALLKILDDSTFITNPQPTPTNITYLLADDQTAVTVDNSILMGNLPAVTHQDIELTPPTAGTYILTGESTWTVQNSELIGNLHEDENHSMDGRWFWFTLQRKAKLKLEDTTCSLHQENNPFIKPVSGYIEIKNCEFISGIIDSEVVSELDITKLTISELAVRDYTSATIRDSNIISTLDVGQASIYSPTRALTAESRINIQDTTVNEVFIQGNATGEIQDCTFNGLSISTNASAIVKGTSFNRIIIKDQALLEIMNSRSSTIFLDGNSKVILSNNATSNTTDTIDWIRTGYNCSSLIKVTNSNITDLDIWPGDNIGATGIDHTYPPDYNSEINRSNVYIQLINSKIENVDIYDDVAITFHLIESSIINITVREFKYEDVSITFINKTSDFTIPQISAEISSTILIQYEFKIYLTLNGEPINAIIEMLDDNNKIVNDGKTDENGYIRFYLTSYIIDENGTSSNILNYTCRIKYYGLLHDIDVVLDSNKVFYENLTDYHPPRITEIEYEQINSNFNDEVKVQVTVIDDGIRSIKNVSLFYSINSGKTWHEISMHELEEGIYEVRIPKQDWGTDVDFYIVTNDILGNRAESKTNTYSVARDVFYIIGVIILVLLILMIIGIVITISRRRKIKKYLNRR